MKASRMQLMLNGALYNPEQLKSMAKVLANTDDQLVAYLWQFIEQWFDDKETMILKTSGSTGIPKNIAVTKHQMLASAASTLEYFQLRKGMKALLCLSPEFIAGKMMIVRAMLGGLDLLTTDLSANPLRNLHQAVDFAAMVPLQCSKVMEETPEKFSWIKTLIVGGSGMGDWLSSQFQSINTAVFQTYGMTETLSHIAVRRVNGALASNSYTLLSGVKVHLDQRGCLVIDAPHLAHEALITNDIAAINQDGTFTIEGRADDIVIVAGHKLNPLQLEAKIEGILQKNCLVIAVPSENAGAQLFLVLKDQMSVSQIYQLWQKLETSLSASEMPRQLAIVDEFPLLAGGKTDRRQLTQLVSNQVK